MDVHTTEGSYKNSSATKPQSSSDPSAMSAQDATAAVGDKKIDFGADNEGKIVLSEAEGDASDKDGPAVAAKTKVKATVQKKKKKAKQFRAKKPKDMPRRPLSGYNIFFKEERARMLAESSGKRGPGETEGEGEIKDSNEPPPAKGVKIGFEAMAKTVGKRWKALPEEELARYKSMAKLDMERYRREMDSYHVDLAKRSRLECEDMLRTQEATAADAAPLGSPVDPQHPGADMRTQHSQAGPSGLGSLDDTMRAQYMENQAAHQMHPQFAQLGNSMFQGSFQPSSGQMQGGMPTSTPGMHDSAGGGANTMQQQTQLLQALLGANSMSQSQLSQQFQQPQQPQQPQQAMMGGGHLNNQQMSMQQQYFMQQAAQQHSAQQQALQQQALQQQALQQQSTNDSSQGNSNFYGNNAGNFMPYGANDTFDQSQNNRGNH
jgi:hypothetical protein